MVKNRDLIGNYTAILAATEIGVGSIVHSFRIPFGGHMLSLNQGIILTMVSRRSFSSAHASRGVNSVSLNTGLLKSLSPAGKKVGPMLALTFQGLFYSVGLFLGRNIVGISAGMILLSIWAFLQPIIVYYFFFGESFFFGIAKIWTEFSSITGISVDWGPWLLLFIVGTKILIALILGAVFWYSSPDFEESYFRFLKRRQAPSVNGKTVVAPSKSENAYIGAFKDLLSPVFLISMFVSFGFLYFQRSQSIEAICLYVLRPLALGYLFFWLARKISPRHIAFIFRRLPSLGVAFEKLNQRSS